MAQLLLSWSGGKDSCLALDRLQVTPGVRVDGLFTTVTHGSARVSMHRVRQTLIERQAAALDVPLQVLAIPAFPSNDAYEAALGAALGDTDVMAFGDLFLADIRAYREQLMKRLGIGAVFPLWGVDTGALMRGFLARGYRAITVCVDTARLPPSFAGRDLDADFLAALPENVDPAGENGEFHSFVVDGPSFRAPIRVERGAVSVEDGFAYCDLLPGA